MNLFYSLARTYVIFIILFISSYFTGFSQSPSISLVAPINNFQAQTPVSFSWSISNLPSTGILFAEIKVYKINSGQTAADAVANNAPKYSATMNDATTVFAIVTEADIDECGEYTWIVTLVEKIPGDPSVEPTPDATFNTLAVSPPGTFSIECDNQRTTSPPKQTYFEIPKVPTPFVFFCKRSNSSSCILHFKYESPYAYNDPTLLLKCIIYNHERNILGNYYRTEIVKGLNYIDWNIAQLSPVTDEVYTLEVTDTKGTTRYLKFKIIN